MTLVNKKSKGSSGEVFIDLNPSEHVNIPKQLTQNDIEELKKEIKDFKKLFKFCATLISILLIGYLLLDTYLGSYFETKYNCICTGINKQ